MKKNNLISTFFPLHVGVFPFSFKRVFMKKLLLAIVVSSSVALSGCSATAENYAADVYDTTQLNSKQETRTVTIISVVAAKVAVDNSANKQRAELAGALLGAVAGGIAGHNVGSGSGSHIAAGAALGGGAGAAAGSMVKDKSLVEGVSLTYKEGTKVFTSTQVGRMCQFAPGLAMVISTKADETRIQPNATCPEKK